MTSSQPPATRNQLPVMCTLTPAELGERREGLIPGLVAHATGRDALPDGYRLRFPVSTDVLTMITATIDAERQCCRFLRFQVTVEPDGGDVTLDVTGPPGTRELLESLATPSGGRDEDRGTRHEGRRT